MDSSSIESKMSEIFLQHTMQEVRRVKEGNIRFAHYTSAEAALSILENEEVWMRKSSCMDDFSEVRYGYRLLQKCYQSESGRKLDGILEGLFSGFVARFRKMFDNWAPHFELDTYITCLSEHDSATENEIGRLSMWRAFGSGPRVALILKNDPFFLETDALHIYSSPVAYLDESKFKEKFDALVMRIGASAEFLKVQGVDAVLNSLFNAFRFACLFTKHPGFHEEREWRVVYSPAMHFSEKMTLEARTIRGVPQQIHKIPLKNIPEDGLVGVQIPELLERVIIGPTQFPNAIYEVFWQTLKRKGVSDPGAKIFTSDIPLRQ